MIQIRLRSIVFALGLSLTAIGAAAGDGQGVVPPPDFSVTTAVPNLPNVGDPALQARLDAARQRLEVDAQQLAALSAQISGPMVQRFQTFAGPPHALIGVQLDQASGTDGARVREVSPGGPAEQAGLRPGDVIVAVNGVGVRGTEPARRAIERLSDVNPGEKVNLEVLRDGKTRDLTVTARPQQNTFFVGREFPDVPLPPAKALAAWGGGPVIISGPVADMELAGLTPGLGRYFGTDAGVLVVRAPPGGGLGLQDGDVILAIGGRKPIDSSHVIRILGSYDPGEKVTLEVMRMHRKISVAATMPAEPRAAFSGRALMIQKGVAVGPGPVVTVSGGDGPL